MLVVDAVTGATRGAMVGHSDKIKHLAYGADGRTLATAGSDGTVRSWPT
ncbi:hypothetical protein [Saccharothrix hoggarensis]|uniref:WD40 repeat protein n=1 Tax=Saccharothrix hoggarensis TaxID=913853 RepID=A0ABW3R512_9PSEU